MSTNINLKDIGFPLVLSPITQQPDSSSKYSFLYPGQFTAVNWISLIQRPTIHELDMKFVTCICGNHDSVDYLGLILEFGWVRIRLVLIISQMQSRK